MYKVIIFGGTTEGRKLCEYCSENGITALYSAATGEGARLVCGLPYTDVQAKRLDSHEMAALINTQCPVLVIDATHPFAAEASVSIAEACEKAGTPLMRIRRSAARYDGCKYFSGMESLVKWLAQTDGNIFAATGSSRAKAFTQLEGYKSRVWLRILPGMDSLRVCLDAGFRAERLICMQGPFSEELNRAMFKSANAKILVTKDSGGAGGFFEKISAAQSVGMDVAVLERPHKQSEQSGVLLEDAFKRIKEL